MSICAPNCCSWQTAAPAAEGKKGRHLRFLPSLNTRFPWQPTLGADGRLRKQEKGNGSRSTAQSLSPPFRNSQTAYCYTCGLISAGAAIDRHSPIPNKNAEAGKAIFPASAVPGKTILAISSVVRGLPKRIIYFSSSVQSRASRMVVHFSYLSSLLLSEYAWLLVASCTAR